MANITLDLTNYRDDDGNFNSQVMHELTAGLDVTFDEVNDHVAETDEVLLGLEMEFIGPYEDLIALIDRYEDDPGMRCDLIMEIKNIHS